MRHKMRLSAATKYDRELAASPAGMHSWTGGHTAETRE